MAVGTWSVHAITALAQEDPQHPFRFADIQQYLQNLLQAQEVAFALPAGSVHLFIVQHQSLQQCTISQT